MSKDKEIKVPVQSIEVNENHPEWMHGHKELYESMTGEEEIPFQPVTVDAGDLAEIQHAATAWAGFLRRSTNNDGTAIFDEAADRIDKANNRVRIQMYESMSKKKGK